MIFAIKYWKAKDLSCASGVWKYHVKLLMLSPGSGLSVTSPGMLNICFRHARPSIVNMWFRHARPWPGENRNNFPWCFLHITILHRACFPSLFFFFFLWKLKKIRYQFLYVIAFCIQCIKKNKKNSKLKREGRSIGDVLLPFFPFTIFFYVHLRRFSIIFFYLISFCTGINTKTEGKKTRN